jgi:hypothetical protein
MPDGSEIEYFKCNARMMQMEDMLEYAQNEASGRRIRICPDDGYFYWISFDGKIISIANDCVVNQGSLWTMTVDQFKARFWGECGRFFFQDPDYPYENVKYKWPTLFRNIT